MKEYTVQTMLGKDAKYFSMQQNRVDPLLVGKPGFPETVTFNYIV